MKIDIHNLRFGYPTGDFNIHIPELHLVSGQSTALVGPSGCGKTTFLNLISSLVKPQEGLILADDLSLGDLNDRQKRKFRAVQTGYVFQDFALIDYLTAYENILYPYLITRRTQPDDMNGRIEGLAESFGISHVLDKKPAQISQGEKQRVAISRAMLTRPPLILADEPMGNLDPDNKIAILDHLLAQTVETGATLVVVTHDTGLAARFDRVLDFTHFGRRDA